MKTLLMSLLVLFVGWFTDDNGLTISDAKVLCVITQNTTDTQLRDFKTELWEKKKIRFDVEQVEVNADKKISLLKINVDCNDGFKGSATMSFDKPTDKVGFYRIYDGKIRSPFGIGRMPF